MLFKITNNSLRHGPANLIRQYSRDVSRSFERADNVSKIHQPASQLQQGGGACTRWNSRRSSTRHFEKASNPEGFMAPSAGVFKRNFTSMTLQMGPVDVLHKGNCNLQMNLQRSFSSNADLPPHQEIGMPSLSPTMTEGNIARWVKKEGDKISPGEVLCEVETDKATVEMECMDDGYLAKIIRGDGTQGIRVGEVIAVTVEEEEHVQNFKDYTPTSDTSVSEAKQPSEPKSQPPSGSSSQSEPKASSSSVKSADLPPHQEIGMPSLSPTMTEGNIARWVKKEGDKVSPGEVLCEVETDKATVEMECMEDGYLAKIIHGDGAQGIKVGEVIAVTVEEEDHIQNFKDYSPNSETSVPETTQTSEPKSQAPVDPISPPEPKTSQPSQASSSSIKSTGAQGKDSPALVLTAAAGVGLDYSDIPHSQIRKVTASRLLKSKQTIPHYYLSVDTCVDNIMELRSELNSLQEGSGLKRISINDLVIKAAALALRKVPQCNSSWMDDCIRQYHNVNINVAVQTENGLYVPIVRDADKKGLSIIAEEVKQLAQKARENSLKPEDYEGGTLTVSNLGGPFGVKQFCAIVNPPQAAILAVGTAEKRVVPGTGGDQVRVASFMPVTLSCDHRVIDGAIGAEWLKAFKGYIEDPESMLL